MSQTEQPLLTLDPNKRYAGFRTLPARKRGLSASMRAILWLIALVVGAIGMRMALHSF